MSSDPYFVAHRMVYETRGDAADQPCSSCGKQARDWALVQGSSEEALNEKGQKYSNNPQDYRPMCRSCHAKYDGWGEALQDESVRMAGVSAARDRYRTDPSLRGSLSTRGGKGGRVSKPKARRRCLECRLESFSGGIATHQAYTGHSGWEDIEEEII